MFRLLSQTFGPLRKGFAYDTPMGGFPICEVFMNVAAASATAVRTAVTLGDAAQTVTSSINNPATPRNLTVKGNASGIAGNVVIYGKDLQGHNIVETIALSGSSEVAGNLVFTAVDKIVMPAKTNSSGDTVSVGIGVKIGLARPFAATGSIQLIEAAGTPEAADAVSVAYGTVTFTTAPNGTNDYKVYYKATVL